VGALWAPKSEGVGLIVRAISFRDFQRMWSWSTNVTDRRTDGRTDGRTTCDRKTALCTIVHRAVKTTDFHWNFGDMDLISLNFDQCLRHCSRVLSERYFRFCFGCHVTIISVVARTQQSPWLKLLDLSLWFRCSLLHFCDVCFPVLAAILSIYHIRLSVFVAIACDSRNPQVYDSPWRAWIYSRNRDQMMKI